MKFQSVRHILFLLALAFLLFLGFSFYNKSKGPNICQKQNSTFMMTRSVAAKLAKEGCKEGILWPISYECNPYTGTWWIPLFVQGHKGCSPACVVNVETKVAEINWRCTGLKIK